MIVVVVFEVVVAAEVVAVLIMIIMKMNTGNFQGPYFVAENAVEYRQKYIKLSPPPSREAGIACWSERRTRDRLSQSWYQTKATPLPIPVTKTN